MGDIKYDIDDINDDNFGRTNTTNAPQPPPPRTPFFVGGGRKGRGGHKHTDASVAVMRNR